MATTHRDLTYKKENSLNYHLSFEFGFEGINAAVLDVESNKYIAVEIHEFAELFTWKALNSKLQASITGSEILNNRFKSVGAALVSDVHTLIPKAVFEEGREQDYLGFTHNLTEPLITRTDEMLVANAVNIYAMDAATKDLITGFFPNASLLHYSTALIEPALRATKGNDAHRAYLNVRNNQFDLMVVKDGHLLFSNTFTYQTPEDVVYYTLYASEQIGIDPKKAAFVFIGKHGEFDKYNQILGKYVSRFSAHPRTSQYHFASFFSNFEEHELTSLVNQHVCV